MTVYKYEPGCQQWLDHRTQYVTGTEVASLFAMNPSKGAKKVLADKLEPPPRFDNKWMRAGRLLEPGVILAMQEAGMPVVAADDKLTVFVAHDTCRLASSMDAKMNVEEGFYVVECKTTSLKKFDTWEDKVPENYALQVHSQMLVSGAKQALIGCLSYEFPFPLIVYEIKRSQFVEDLIMKEVDRFWDCYEKNTPFVVEKQHQKDMRSILDSLNTKIIEHR